MAQKIYPVFIVMPKFYTDSDKTEFYSVNRETKKLYCRCYTTERMSPPCTYLNLYFSANMHGLPFCHMLLVFFLFILYSYH